MTNNVKQKYDRMQEILGDIVFDEMMTDIRNTIELAYNTKIEEYIARAPQTDMAMVTILNMTPGVFVSTMLMMHKVQKNALQSEDTPIKQMYRDAVELFDMTDEQMENQRDYFVSTHH